MKKGYLFILVILIIVFALITCSNTTKVKDNSYRDVYHTSLRIIGGCEYILASSNFNAIESDVQIIHHAACTNGLHYTICQED